MNDFDFYVIDDLNKNGYHMEHFSVNDFEGALNLFLSLDKSEEKIPCLGVQFKNGGLDLVHCRNGENVLVEDYRMSKHLSAYFNSIKSDIEHIVAKLIDTGAVKYQYDKTISVPSAKIIVPISDKSEKANSYCEDKLLKTSHRSGLNAIDSLFIEGHGWVAYNELSKKPEEYCRNGSLKVDMLNVCYTYKKNLVGIDGRMDIKPSDFAKMVDEINKPYSLVAFDGLKYLHQYEGIHNFIVGSYNTLSDAVKAWYDIKENKPSISVFVQEQNDYGRESSIFNGVDDNLNEISYEQAAKLYGFEIKDSIDNILQNAKHVSEMYNNEHDFDKSEEYNLPEKE